MSEADAFARLVLRPRTLEQVEDACLIALGDAASVVSDFDLDTIVGHRAGPYLDLQRPVLCAIFDRVVEQVADDQLQRESVALDPGNAEIDVDLAAGFG